MAKIRPQDSATLQEILSQPLAWKDSLRNLETNAALESVLASFDFKSELLFIGCGTSFYLAEAAAASWTTLTGQTARALPASELLLFPALSLPHKGQTQAVIISRSGSTSEAVRAAIFLAREARVTTVGLTCSPNSPLASECDLTIQLTSADEKSTVMTRSFTSMLLVMQYLAGRKAGDKQLCDSLEHMPNNFSALLQVFSERINVFLENRNFADYVFMGQGPFQGIAREASLKVTEMSCSFSQAYHTLEFRHGPKAIVSPETCLTFFISESGRDSECEVLVEMKDLGAAVIAVCNRANETIRSSSDLVVELGLDGTEIVTLAPAVVPAQLLGFYAGIKKGLNPDSPKNLSRVVLLD
ncbi:MAG: SIS domain-containing protein [Acidobacteriota bacterium]|nr:SIS domain-containing protein [Acidobacteriota bacterium]